MAGSSESTRTHERAAAEHAAASGGVRCAVLTISDTRSLENDASGDLIVRLLEQAAMKVADRAIVRDEASAIRSKLSEWLPNESMDAILTTGGTGIAKRDTTVEVIRSLLVAELEGFGELFRMLSWEQVGPAAMMSRAVGGLTESGVFVFAMPGSINAVETAMTHLILPQLPHMVWERKR